MRLELCFSTFIKLSTLSPCSINGRIRTWIGDYLIGREQQVTVNGSTSQYSLMIGSVLGPFLFFIYVDDLACTLICWQWSWSIIMLTIFYCFIQFMEWKTHHLAIQWDISTIEGWVSSNIHPWILLNVNSWLYLGKWTHPPQPDYPESCMFQIPI